MTNWEYRYLMLKDSEFDQIISRLNELGADGWEAINEEDTGYGITFLMKRPSQMRGNDDPKPAPPGPRCVCFSPKFVDESKPMNAWWRCLECFNLKWVGTRPEPT
jgi:hypothetical protein